MKFAVHLLLIGALAVVPACNRSNTSDPPVSANADRTDSTQPSDATNARRTQQQQQTTREAQPAYRAPEKESTRAPEPAREARNESAERNADNTRPATSARAVTQIVPSGTAVRVTLADMVSTEKNQAGDSFTAHLSEPIVVNGRVVAAKNDRVTGHIAKLDEPGKVKGRARLELVLDEVRTSGKVYKVSTEPFIAVASDNHKRDATEVAGGAAVGAAVGAIAGGGKGAAIGAIIGGGTGTTAVLLTKGKQLELEPETKVNFVLSKDVDLPVIRNSAS
jgi:hypothetical protein